MSMIKCPECGKEISDKAEKCPNCGCPMEEIKKIVSDDDYQAEQQYQDMLNRLKARENKKSVSIAKSYDFVGRMIVGIIYIVVSCLVLFQSCAAQLSNSITGEGIDGAIGFLLFLYLLVIGIVSISTKKSSSYKIPMCIGVLNFIFGFLLSEIYKGMYKDLKYWGWLLIITAFVYLIEARKIKPLKNK